MKIVDLDELLAANILQVTKEMIDPLDEVVCDGLHLMVTEVVGEVDPDIHGIVIKDDSNEFAVNSKVVLSANKGPYIFKEDISNGQEK
jgi:hypothetical protein